MLQVRYKALENKFSNNFSLRQFQKRKKGYQKKLPREKNHKNAKTSHQIVLFSSKTVISNHFVYLLTVSNWEHKQTNWNSLSSNGFVVNTL